MIYIVVGGIVVIIVVISALIAVKSSRRVPETGEEPNSSEQEWEQQLRQIKRGKMEQGQKRKQIELITRKENERVKRIFWPRILTVCKKFAEVMDLECGVVEIDSILMDFVNYFGDNNHFGDDIKEYYYAFPAKLCKLGLGDDSEIGIAEKIGIYLITRYRFSNSSLGSCIYIIPRKGYEREYRVIYINQFTEELLLNKLKRSYESIEHY